MSKRWLWLAALAAFAGCTIEMPDTFVNTGDGQNTSEQDTTTTVNSADNGGDVDK